MYLGLFRSKGRKNYNIYHFKPIFKALHLQSLKRSQEGKELSIFIDLFVGFIALKDLQEEYIFSIHSDLLPGILT